MSDDDSYLLPDPPADPDHPWRRLVRLVARLLAEKKLKQAQKTAGKAIEAPKQEDDMSK